MIPSFEAVSAHDEESRAFWQDRLAPFGKLGGLFFLALGSIRLAVLLGRPEAQHWGLHEGSRSLFATAVALGAAWVGCRRGRRSAEALRWIDAASLVVAGASLASFGVVRLPFLDVTYPIVMNVALVLIARAVIVPSAASQTLGLSFAASMPAILTMVWNAARSGWAPGVMTRSAADAAVAGRHTRQIGTTPVEPCLRPATATPLTDVTPARVDAARS